MALPVNTLTVQGSGMLMTNDTAWIAQQWNTPVVKSSGGCLGCARNKENTSEMRWYMARALECGGGRVSAGVARERQWWLSVGSDVVECGQWWSNVGSDVIGCRQGSPANGSDVVGCRQ